MRLICHCERVRSTSVAIYESKAILDSSPMAQNDKIVGFRKKYCHTLCCCHTDLPSCHTERSEVSKHKGKDLQGNVVCLDSSLSAKAQNDRQREKSSQ